MDWARILAYVTGTVDQELLARNAPLVSLRGSKDCRFFCRSNFLTCPYRKPKTAVDHPRIGR
jgi:hypothetical protein